MNLFKLPALIALGTLLIACSGQSLDEPMTGSVTTGGAAGSGGLPSTGGIADGACWDRRTPGCPGAGGLPAIGGTGGLPATGGSPDWVPDWPGGYGGEPIGGSPATGGIDGTGGITSYFAPAPEQPTDFSCCVIWAFCVGHPYDYRCTEATLQVTTSDRKDACDIWLQQVQDPIGAESIPACL